MPPDTRAKIGALVIEAIRGIEAEVGMSIWEYAARKAGVWETGLISDEHTPAANAPQFFQLLKCGRWLPLNWYGMPVGHRGLVEGGDPWDREACAHLAVHFPVDPYTVSAVWLYNEDRKDGMLWLYSDEAPAAHRTYFKRYARLMEAMDTWRSEDATAPAPAS